MDGVIAYVTLFAGNFAPKSWAFCAGQLLPISQNTALFSLIGTYYGGNGTTTFALPDLQGRSAVSSGTGPGLSTYDLGEQTGVETTLLLTNQMASHTHSFTATVAPESALTNASTGNPNTAVFAPEATGNTAYSSNANNNMQPYNIAVTMSPTGSSVPFSNRNPYLALNYIICLQGVFPQRP